MRKTTRGAISSFTGDALTSSILLAPPPQVVSRKSSSMDDASVEPTAMALDLLKEITNGFCEERELGSGSFGKVYLGVYPDGVKIAVKMLKNMQGIDDKKFQHEFKIMTKLRHPNILRLVGYCHDIQEIPVLYEGKLVLAAKIHRALCLEYMPNGSLDRFLSDECDRYDWHKGYQIIKGICQGLNYLHNESKPPMYHLDLKPANILLDEDMVPRIADFGMSRLFSNEQTQSTQSLLGTLGYSPPEFIDSHKISNKFDIFSLGVIIIKITAGRSGYSNSFEMSSQEFLNLVHEKWTSRLHGRSNLRKAYCEQVKICIQIGLRCVQKDRHKRPTIEDVVDMLNETERRCTYASEKDWLLIYQDCYIPDYILKPDCEPVIIDHAPHCPVVVFINPRSGHQLGSILIETYRELLNGAQVFDLSEEAPDKVLHRLYANFEKLKSQGDILAVQIQRSLRLIVAGGDGTASWLLGVVSDLKLSQPLPVAIMPLGPENNLALSLGWGKKNPATDTQAVKSFLAQVKSAREMNIDSWLVLLRMRVPPEGPCDPIAPLELPHSLHAFHRVSGSDSLNVDGYHTFRGGFWNYFSMGMDAQVSYKFHSARKINSWKVTDQGTHSMPRLKQGWLPASLSQPSSWNIAQLAKIKVMKRPYGRWEELCIPRSIQSIVCLNLPSFSGGLNPWGVPGTRKAQDRDLTAPYIDDGLLEVVGFKRAWHGIDLLAPNGHGVRLAQVHRIRFEFHKGAARHTFMKIDGEPWKQPLPCDDEVVVVEISHCRQVTVLVSDPCRSKSIDDPTSPSCYGHDNDEDDDLDSLDDEDEWQGTRKFGAADTFKLPDDVDIAHLS